jgi:hypothetical protein
MDWVLGEKLVSVLDDLALMMVMPTVEMMALWKVGRMVYGWAVK